MRPSSEVLWTDAWIILSRPCLEDQLTQWIHLVSPHSLCTKAHIPPRFAYLLRPNTKPHLHPLFAYAVPWFLSVIREAREKLSPQQINERRPLLLELPPSPASPSSPLTGREITCRRRLKTSSFREFSTFRYFSTFSRYFLTFRYFSTFRIFGTFWLFGTFQLFGTCRLFMFLVTFRLFGRFRLFGAFRLFDISCFWSLFDFSGGFDFSGFFDFSGPFEFSTFGSCYCFALLLDFPAFRFSSHTLRLAWGLTPALPNCSIDRCCSQTLSQRALGILRICLCVCTSVCIIYVYANTYMCICVCVYV